ncbi:MAG: hypothetical protein AAEJ04_00270 [Planctomycetota bacterium]
MSRIKKLLVVVTLLLLAVGGLYLYKDAAVRAGVIAGGDQVLGAGSTRLDAAAIDPFAGHLMLQGLYLKNPTGYQEPHFFQMKGFDTALSLGSLLEDRVVVPRVELDGIHLLAESIIDKDGPRFNLLTIQQQLGSSTKKKENSVGESGGKKFVIEVLTVKDMMVTGMITIPGGRSWPLDLKVPTFEITDIGQKSKGVLLAEVMVIVLDTIIAKAIEVIESDGSDRWKVLGDAKDLLKIFGGDLKEAALDSKLGKKLIDEAVKKGLGDLFKKKKER